jgi:hypothetical protein
MYMPYIRSSVKMDDIPKFEKQNDVSINIFGYEFNSIIFENSRAQNLNKYSLTRNIYCKNKTLLKGQLHV